LENKNSVKKDITEQGPEHYGVMNLLSTILHSYSVKKLPYLPSQEIPHVQEQLGNKKENVVLFILDGLGNSLLENSSAPFLKRHNKGPVQAPFPPTTASVLTSLYYGVPPSIHGLIGWRLFYKEYCGLFDVLPRLDSITRKPLPEALDLLGTLPEKNIFELIADASPQTETFLLTLDKVKKSPYTKRAGKAATLIPYKKPEQIPDKLEPLLKENDNPKFIFVYSNLPDSLEHEHGTNSGKVRQCIKSFDRIIEQLYLHHKERSAFFITADHGLIDTEIEWINDDPELYNALLLPPYPEARFITLHIKPSYRSVMPDILEKYKDNFLILTGDEFIRKQLLDFISRKNNQGENESLEVIRQYPGYSHIGDYVLIATGNKGMRMRYPSGDNSVRIATHSGLTNKEVYVPLIVPS